MGAQHPKIWHRRVLECLAEVSCSTYDLARYLWPKRMSGRGIVDPQAEAAVRTILRGLEAEGRVRPVHPLDPWTDWELRPPER